MLAEELVVAAAALEGVVASLADERVGAGDACHPNLLAVSAQQVIPAAAVQDIAAASADERVVAAVAFDEVLVRRTRDILKAADGIAFGMASRHVPGGEVHGHARIGARVGEPVLTSAPVEPVGAVVAVENVVTAVADERVVMREAPDILEAADDVAFGMASRHAPGGKVYRDARVGEQVVEPVLTHASVEPVGAVTTLEIVVSGVADERVAMPGALDIPDAADDVAGGLASRSHPGGKVHGHPRIGVPVREPVPPAPAVEPVGTAEAFEHIVTAVADERVVKRGPNDILEAADGVTGGMASRHASGGKIHGHPRIGVPVREPVPTGPAVEAVGARAAVQDVVAGPALEAVVAATAYERVVSRSSGEDVVAISALESIVAVGTLKRLVANSVKSQKVRCVEVGKVQSKMKTVPPPTLDKSSTTSKSNPSVMLRLSKPVTARVERSIRSSPSVKSTIVSIP